MKKLEKSRNSLKGFKEPRVADNEGEKKPVGLDTGEREENAGSPEEKEKRMEI